MEAIGEVAMDVVEERMEGNEVNGTGSSFQVLNTSAEEDSNAVCAVCLELDETDDNLIVFCDKCSVPVHQYCYGVAVIPEGPWYCNVCAIEGMDVASTLCDLCLQPSGALKPTTVPHRWVHLKCATWIPEVYCMDCSVMEPYNLERVDRNRFRLKCGVCKKVKGACIQCSYGRCQHSVHPTCALQREAGWTRRIIKNVEGENTWEMFCTDHASAVKDPVKPKAKQRAVPLADDAGESLTTTVTTTTTVLQRPRGAAYGRSKAAEDYAAGRLPTTQPVPVDILNAVIAASFAAVAELQESRREESSEGNKVSSGTATATVHTMSEWPGQAEGEGMDLEHFWNIVSMSFPEDHSSSWLQSLYAAITQHFSTGDKYTSLHRLGTASDKLQMETSDSIFGHLSEREKLAKLDPEKRFELQQNLMQHLALLSHSLPSTSFLVSESKQRHLVGIDDFLITSSSLVSIQENKKEDDSQLRVVFDGNERKECTYTINERSASCPSFLMDPASVNPFLLGPPPPSLTSCEETKSIDAASVQLILESWSKLSNEQSVFLWDREIISRDKQDELNFMIRSDQIYYQKFAEFVLPLLESLMTDRLSVCCSKGIEERSQWAALENVYRCQRIWKKVATLTASGMRELGIEAPPVAEVVPASWSVPVDGRPKPEEASGPSASDDSVCLVCFDGTSSEDNSILFCDGCNSSVHQACYGIAEVPEGQFFCDRCQAIQRLLDNDAIDFDPVLYGRDAINCCLCTSYHGGLKPTTDGRWVHLCCALWSQLAVIENLDDMAPVNVTPLRLQPTLSRDTRQSQLSEEGDVVRNGESKLELVESTVLQSEKVDSSAMVNELITDVCRVCRIAGGLVIRCSGDVACPVVFHPICGWFEGLYVKVHLNDPTFQGLDRGGLFPSGLVYTFCCLSHTPPEFSDYKLRKHQQILRRKFRLDERDLDIVPGQLRRKKKRRSVLMPAAVQRVTTSTVIAKELTPDVYDSSYCAACLAPIPDYVPPYLRNKNEAVAAAAASTVTLTVKCSDCGICLHQDCLPSKHVLPPAGDWKCTVCLFNEKDARCYCCPRRGGFFNTLAEGGWIHEYCANHMPVAKRTNLEGAIEVRSIPKEFRKQKCAFCNRKTGVCVRCSHLGCSVYFHALCGARNDRLYIRHEYESTVAFCVDHIPAGITWVSEGYWVDLHELTNLRLGLDKARLIADTVRRRDKLKRSLYKIEGESFALSFNRLLDRAMGRKGILNSPGNNTDLNELYYGSDGSCYSDEDIDHIKTSDFKADKEAAGGQDGAMAGIIVSTDVGELLISSTWISEDELKVPRKVKVTLSGLAIGRTDTLAYKEKEFKLTFLPKLTEELERNLKSNIYVRKSGDLSYLLKTLTTELAEYGRLSFKQFTEEMIRKGVEVKKPKVTRSSKVKFAEEKVEIKKSQDSGTLTVVEISDQLRSSVWTKLQLAVEGLPRSFHLDIPLLEEEEAYLVDWRPATDVVNLERRLQFILDSICDFKLDGPRAKRRKSEPMESRNIVEDFEEIPYDLIPYYDTMVRHPLSLAVIRSRLQSHTYSTLAAFANDVYEMLSNARFITGEDSTIWHDAEVLRCVFEDAKLKSSNLSALQLSRNKGLVAKPLKATKGSKSAVVQICSVCNTEYEIKGWDPAADLKNPFAGISVAPQGKSNKKKKRTSAVDNADAKLAWSWICPSCVTNEGEALYGRRIGIWWVDDQLFYFGNVGDYDATSRCHRIAYQDNEWEFVNLGSEIVLFADASEVENDRETSRRSHKKKKVSETSSLPATSRQSLASPTISPGDVVFNSAGTRASSRRGSNTDAGSMDRIVERRPSPLLASDNGVFRRGRNESAADSGSLAPSRVRSNRTSTAKNYH